MNANLINLAVSDPRIDPFQCSFNRDCFCSILF
uniref:Uncharacterized protein n=1 Tax=Anguilla anguilla TaxID=7936 RepID=A0A0E9QTD3_ANGAN